MLNFTWQLIRTKKLKSLKFINLSDVNFAILLKLRLLVRITTFLPNYVRLNKKWKIVTDHGICSLTKLQLMDDLERIFPR